MSLDVLIVDQDVELARLYGGFLTTYGFSAATAPGGPECLERIHQEGARVLVLDRELLCSDGEGVLARLREDWWPGSVILTAWNISPEIIPQLLVPPVVLCLRKFFPLSALLQGVRLAVNGYEGREASSDSHAGPRPAHPGWAVSR